MSVGRRTLLAFTPQAMAIISAIVMSVITARILGPSGRGQIAIALLTASVVVLVADGGLSSALTYFVSRKALASSEATALAGSAAVVLGGAAAGLATAAYPALAGSVLNGMAGAVYAAAMASVPGSLFVMLWSRARMAQGDFVVPALVQSGLSIGATTLAAVLLLGLDGDVFELVAALTMLYSCVAIALFAREALREGASLRFAPGLLREVATYCGRAYVGNLVSYAGLRVDTYVLNAFRGPADVGRYSIAVTISEKLWLVDSSVGQATLPEVASREQDRAAALVATANRLVILTTTVVAALAWALAPWIVNALYGTAYLASADALRILLPGAVAYASGRTLLQYHQGHLGRPGTVSWVMALSSAVGLALYFILVPRYGMNGAALASSAAYASVFVCGAVLFTTASGIPVAHALVPRLTDVRAVLARRLERASDSNHSGNIET